MNDVQKLIVNFRQVGSVTDAQGAGEDYDVYEVGKTNPKGETIIGISENQPKNGLELWNFKIYYDNGKCIRVFNPNYIEYVKIDRCDK